MAGGGAGAGSPVTSLSTSEKMSEAVSSGADGAAAAGIRTVRDPTSVDSRAERTAARRSSSEKGLTRRSKAPTRCASAFGLLPL